MTCTVLRSPPRLHTCVKPNAHDYRVDTIIQCDECGKVWKAKSEYSPAEWASYWTPFIFQKRARKKFKRP